ncbi:MULTISPECIES: phage baseplate assembly protein V [Yersinia pseudotuberculosis complex]|uniref:phage baseplate assembly protein V n=1 Tax=Yersinia pseudotuberculosis complex TaxID=1649845 RepID=UPI0004F7BF21|nr:MULTISPECIES: phage baseplate assembly protein V [Yersinia pseudotuberculosis complex]AIN14277.1 phage baseplate assembly V family protein [Yersinia pseudotuberculosis]MBO1548754.1 phage baseplate assembly protein V [Yersinia pseudotuberculosis]MBO1561858.1 phage baseplate assembly protein V [Yersinia pseudotuberculosis]MBO1568967.1 phage baseplate assembly protein V [Yersinia pseudotuberculosis]MBO1583698.1 phage baseplate assembly protein V [Yersinia pseudotuberculosis]
MSAQLKFGYVSAWEPKTCRIRVSLPEQNGLETYWLQVPQVYTKLSRRRSPVEMGTQVAILLQPDGVGGILLGAVYSTVDPPPIDDDDTDYIEYKDGAVLSYAPSSHNLDVSLPAGGSLNIVSPTGITINAQAGITIRAAAGIDVTGDIRVSGDVIANGISLKKHCHSGVTPGLSLTGPPAE